MKNTMNLLDVSRLIDSLRFRAGSLSDLSRGLRTGSRGYGRQIALTPELKNELENMAEAQYNLRRKLEQLVENVEVKIEL